MCTDTHIQCWLSVAHDPLLVCDINTSCCLFFLGIALLWYHHIPCISKGERGGVVWVIKTYNLLLLLILLLRYFFIFSWKSENFFQFYFHTQGFQNLFSFLFCGLFSFCLSSLLDWLHCQPAAGYWGCTVGFQQVLAEIIGKLQLTEAATFMLLLPVGFLFWMRSLCVLLPVGTWVSPATWCLVVCESWLHRVLVVLSLDRLNESVHAIESWQLMGKEESNNFFFTFWNLYYLSIPYFFH